MKGSSHLFASHYSFWESNLYITNFNKKTIIKISIQILSEKLMELSINLRNDFEYLQKSQHSLHFLNSYIVPCT